MKKCGQCKKLKKISKFSKDVHAKDKLQYRCKQCSKINRRKYYLKNKIKEIKRAIKWNRENPERKKEIRKAWSKKNIKKII